MPAKFDPSAVELMRHLISRAKPEGHLFPLAMHSGEMMPPPKSTEKALGERRLTNFTGVGETPTPADAAFSAVTDLYLELEAAIRDPNKRLGFQQPWKSQ